MRIGEFKIKQRFSLGELKAGVRQLTGNFEEITVTPSEEQQVFEASKGMDGISKVTVEEIPEQYIVPSGEIEITKNNTYDVKQYERAKINVPIPDLSSTTATENDVVSGKQFYNASGELKTGAFVNPLQWKCDILNKLDYEFYITNSSVKLNDEDVIRIMSGIDTKNVKTLEYTFGVYTTGFKYFVDLSPMVIDMSNCTNTNCMFRCQSYLTKPPTLINVEKLQNITSMYQNCSRLTEIDFSNWNVKLRYCSSVFQECSMLTKVNLSGWDTSSVNSFQWSFRSCTSLVEIIGDINMIKATSGSEMFSSCRALTTVTLRNIKVNLTIGSGTNYGHLLTLDTLLNTIKEYHINTTTSTRTLTMGTANTAKLENVYVKLVDITDEMRAEDEYIDNKLPFEVCESTDEGAMHIINDYAQVLKI